MPIPHIILISILALATGDGPLAGPMERTEGTGAFSSGKTANAPARRLGMFRVTSFCPCKKCCGPRACGITASGQRARPGMVACNVLPLGTRISIEGLGAFTVTDRMAKRMTGNRIDIYCHSHKAALAFGVKWLTVQKEN
jgi:3D (Asp-Asp-Asp) domain-containing protein